MAPDMYNPSAIIGGAAFVAWASLFIQAWWIARKERK